MKKSELIEKVLKSASKNTKTEVSKKLVETIISNTFDTIFKAVKKEGRHMVPGFGTFTKTKRAARMGRNPKTGETIKIKASKSIRFKPSTILKGKL